MGIILLVILILLLFGGFHPNVVNSGWGYTPGGLVGVLVIVLVVLLLLGRI